MRRRFSSQALILGGAAALAAFLTIFQRTPEGLMGFGVGEREVRAAPGAPSSSVERKHDLSELRVFNGTLFKIQDSYVDPTRINPQEMLFGALESVQYNVPEVLVEIDRSSSSLTVSVNDQKRQFDASSVDSPWRLSGLLKKIMRFVEANMNAGADLAEVEYAAVNGMLATLDPHSVLLDPEVAREMDASTQGHFGGLGIVIGMRKRYLTVLKPMPGTPAHAAGILKGDKILRINDEVTENLTLQESVNRMRGKPGTKITLWVKREGTAKLLRFEITRARIKVPSVKGKLLDKGVGYIKIESFAGETTDELKKMLAQLRDQGATRWILDLRNNPGGLLEQAIHVADVFLANGTIVTTVSGQERDQRSATRSGADTQTPIAVLVNAGSASASEIVAGALKNLDRAVIIGTNTFGKGSVQILYDNNDKSKLKLTIAEYLTPGNLSIQSLGIVPDIELSRMLIPDKNDSPVDYIRLSPPQITYGEKDLKAHLHSRFAKKTAAPTMSLQYLHERESKNATEDEEEEDEEELDDDDEEIVVDFEIGFARDLLAQTSKANRKQILRSAGKLVERRSQAEQSKAKTKLAKLGVDWSAAPKQKKSSAVLDARFELKGNPTSIVAGTELELVGAVTNNGSEPAYRVVARVDSEHSVFFNDRREFVFGKIAPGETKTWTSFVKVPDAARDRVDELIFEVTEANDAPAQKRSTMVRIVSKERPVFAYSHRILDSGNGDGLVQPGESHKILVTIKNTGEGTAEETTAILRNTSGDMLRISKARFELDELKPGAQKTVAFEFAATEKAKGTLVVEMSVYDAKLGESIVEKLRYRVRGDANVPTPAAGSATVERAAFIYEGAAGNSAKIAEAPKGAVLAVTGLAGEWYRVDVGGKPGFISRDVVTHSKSRRASTKNLKKHWQVTPPRLTLNLPSYEATGDSYRLDGKIVDDTEVSDFFVYVSNREAKVSNKKVVYRSNRRGTDPRSMLIDANIPLWPGLNAITVVARQNSEVQTSESFYLLRRSGRQGAVAKEQKAQ